jgi:hypothetical protein
MREMARRVLDALRCAVRLAARIAEQVRPALARPDRPAWATPYGPPPRRR